MMEGLFKKVAMHVTLLCKGLTDQLLEMYPSDYESWALPSERKEEDVIKAIVKNPNHKYINGHVTKMQKIGSEVRGSKLLTLGQALSANGEINAAVDAMMDRCKHANLYVATCGVLNVIVYKPRREDQATLDQSKKAVLEALAELDMAKRVPPELLLEMDSVLSRKGKKRKSEAGKGKGE